MQPVLMPETYAYVTVTNGRSIPPPLSVKRYGRFAAVSGGRPH
ncbi:MAG TPA: hypothetical protein VFA20_12085 [Myxococcaceae bacterium]|nr:hypothetical protein [Myxococcaceae bacterium]